MGHASVNPLVATYTKYLNTNAEMAGFLTGMFFVVAFACRSFTGYAITKLDKRMLLIWVFLVGVVANVGYALFHSVPAFIIFRFLSGVQYSLLGPLLMALSGDHLPMSRLAYGLGVFGIGGAISNAIAPTIGAAILDFGISLGNERLGFSLLFLFGAVMFLIAVVPSAMIAPDTKTVEYLANTGKWYQSIFSIHAMPAGIVMLLMSITYAIINTYVFEFAVEQGIAGISSFYIVLAIMLAISRPLSGYITIKIGMTQVVFPALVLFAFAMIVIGFSTTLWMALVGSALSAIGYGSAQPSINAMSLQSEPAELRGVATNTLYMGIDLGLFLGPFLGGLVYARSTYANMFKTGAIPVALAAICFIFVIPVYKRRVAEVDKLNKS